MSLYVKLRSWLSWRIKTEEWWELPRGQNIRGHVKEALQASLADNATLFHFKLSKLVADLWFYSYEGKQGESREKEIYDYSAGRKKHSSAEYLKYFSR